MVAMPTKRYVWKATDKAASYLIQCLVAESHLGYTGIERASNGEIGYNRVRDLCLGLKAPARLSEFLLICDICKADPIIVLRKILETAAGQPFYSLVGCGDGRRLCGRRNEVNEEGRESPLCRGEAS